MDLGVLPSKLLSRLQRAAETVRKHEFIHLFSHYDADGISSAAITSKTLFREGKDFKLTLFNTLDGDSMDIIRGSGAECVLITDLGASYIEEFEAMDCDVVVLDHHTVSRDSEKVVYANPHLEGIDGMTSGCGATMAFLFSVVMKEENWDLVQIAFAGMSGDRQTAKGVSGLNAHLLEGARKRGLVEEREGSLIPSGQLSSELFLGTDPYIRGVSGSVEGASQLLADAGIDSLRGSEDLDEEEERRLSSLIALKLTAQGVSVSTMEEIARTRYRLRDWGMDSEALASVLDACGRQGLGGIGVAAGMGDERSRVRAEELDREYRRRRVEEVRALEERGLTPMENIQFFDSSSSGLTGVICGVAMQYIGDPDKPTIGLNCADITAHMSSRGTWSQLDKGIDLARAMRQACESVGGEGGGHRIAAGGSIPSERNREFLVNLDRIIGEQLGPSRSPGHRQS